MTALHIPAAVDFISANRPEARLIVESCLAICDEALAPLFLAKMIDARWTGATLEMVYAQCFAEAGIDAHRRLLNNLFEPRV